MRTKRAELALERLLRGVEQELLAASDDEVQAVVDELGIKPGMQGSIALIGITKLVVERGETRAALPPQRKPKRSRRRSPKDDSWKRE
jgi:hypothetical protein